MIFNLITKALIFKPKKLKDGWEHKNGFYVSHSTQTTMNVINEKRSSFDYNQKNYYSGLGLEALRSRANSLLYRIESSLNNYFDFLWYLSLFFGGFLLLKLISIVWQYPKIDDVRLMIALLIYLPIIGFFFWKKKELEKNMVNEFLLIERAIKDIENT